MLPKLNEAGTSAQIMTSHTDTELTSRKCAEVFLKDINHGLLGFEHETFPSGYSNHITVPRIFNSADERKQ